MISSRLLHVRYAYKGRGGGSIPQLSFAVISYKCSPRITTLSLLLPFPSLHPELCPQLSSAPSPCSAHIPFRLLLSTMQPPFPSLTATWHNESYPAISPIRPELSAAGKTVIIAGAVRHLLSVLSHPPCFPAVRLEKKKKQVSHSETI